MHVKTEIEDSPVRIAEGNDAPTLEEILIYIIKEGRNLKTQKDMAVHLDYFLRYCVKTQDEHDHENPFKQLPFDTKPYLYDLAMIWLINPLVVIAKSRQLMVTWVYCACFLWDTMFREGRLNIMVSKKEDDADKLIKRVAGIYDRLPESVKSVYKVKRTPKGETSAYCKMEFQESTSQLIGLSQDPNAIRQNTASNILCDEASFQDRLEECFTAMKPTLDGGGRLIMVSTPNGKEFFYKIFNDMTDDVV